MLELDELLTESSSTVLKAVLLVAVMLVLGGMISLILCLSLLSKLTVCGETVLYCGMVILAIIFLSLVAPLVMLWWARGYVLLKVLYRLFKLYEGPVLQQCAYQICKHRESLVAVGELKKSQLVGEIPLPVRVLMSRLDLAPILLLFKNHPALQLTDLVASLKGQLEAQAIIQKPSMAWWWATIGLMFLVTGGVWWLV